MPRRYILTGAPGAGKTALIRRLEVLGQEIVEEAATDIIALSQAAGIDRPWERPAFIADIASLQRQRETAPMRGEVRFADRSLFCTLALAEFLGHPVPSQLSDEAAGLVQSGWYEPTVFFVDQLGFMVNTEARRISFEDAVRFGAVHEAVYRRFGFELMHVAAAPIEERVVAILGAVR